MPDSPALPLSRRRFVATAVGAAGLVGVAAAGGCTLPGTEPGPDALQPLADAAARDALELAAADSSHGADAARLHRMAEVRRVHADRLAEEIRRLHTGDDDEAPQAGNPAPAPVCPPTGQVRDRLRTDARRAAEVAAGAEGYRAELAAAVSAACTAAAEVALA